MKKILLYINAIHYGGAEKVLVNLANRFATNDYKTIVVTSFYDQEEYSLSEQVKRISLEQDNVPQSFLVRNITRIRKLRKICKKEKPDLVISFMGEANFRAIIATLFLGIPTLISVRNDPEKEYEGFLLRTLAKILFRFADGCVFQTEEARNWFPESIKRRSKNILNEVDEKFYKINYNGPRRHIIAVGRLEPQKNHKLLINAFRRIADSYPEENLIIYGNGSLYDELTNYIDQLNLSGRVILQGAVMNIQEMIFDAKLFVLSSDYEGLPNVIMEAMTLGIPVISTDCPCGGPRLLIGNNQNGILVPVYDTTALANAMDLVLSDTELLNELSIRSKLRSQDFEPNVVFEYWKDYVDEIIND